MENEQLVNAQENLDSFRRNYVGSGGLEEFSHIGKKIIEACSKIESSWSGSPLGWHCNMYYGDFEPPPLNKRFSVEWGGRWGIPQGWQERQNVEVVAEIERSVGQSCFSHNEYPDKIEEIREAVQDLRNEIIISWSISSFGSDMEEEKNLLAMVENFSFGKRGNEYLTQRLAGRRITRDMKALSQGVLIPSHFYYESFAQEGISFSAAVKDFLRLADRIVRQIEEKSKNYSRSVAKIPQDKQMVEKVCKRFHLVVKQLQKRYNGRAPLSMEDEYDVQDVLHALLHIFFDDIRKEEWTPSYAGGSSRMDFLLKEESIVIEVKKTRDGLKAREVADQLIIDIDRYKVHPDCKELICFVYDPDERIDNPRALENDLSRREGSLTVRVLIVPYSH